MRWSEYIRYACCLVVLGAGFAPLQAACPPGRVRENTFPLPQGVYINYRFTGSGDSVIVALNGFGASLDTWNGMEPFLSADHRFYAIDLPGFGLSAHPRHFGYTLKEQSESVAAFLQFVHDENPGRKITLMGHSFGGSIAIATAVLLLDRGKTLVDSLILIDALGFPQIVHLPLQLNILSVPVLSHLVLSLVPARTLARSALRSGMYRRERVTKKQVCQFAQFISAPGGHDSLVRTIQQIRKPEAVELSARIPEIRIPALIVWGSHDSLLSPDQAELLHRALPASRPVVFVEAGHLAHQELPEDTAKLIEEFLAHGGVFSSRAKRTFHEASKAARFGS